MTHTHGIFIGILVLVVLIIVLMVLEPKKRKYEKQFHKTFLGMWELLEHRATEQQKEEWYKHFTKEIQLNDEFKIIMNNGLLWFTKVEVYQKKENEFQLVGVVRDERLEGGNAWLNLEGNWAECVYSLLEKEHKRMNQEKTMELEGVFK